MTTFTTHFPARTPVSLLLSVVLHGSVIAGILYTSLHYSAESPKAPQPIAITMVAPQIQPEPAPATVMPEPEPEPEPEPQAEAEPQIAPEPPKAEPVAIPKPEPKPKPKPKAEPRPKPKAEPKPRPVKKVEPERRPQTTAQKNPFKTDTPATQTQPATAPKTTSAATTSAAAGPEALSISKPAYPARAAALRIEGKVRLKFDVNSAGRVENVTIISAEPRNMFERSVKDQVKKWRYQSGQPGKGVTMTIVFRMNGGANIE